MKKILTFVLLILLLFSFYGCDQLDGKMLVANVSDDPFGNEPLIEEKEPKPDGEDVFDFGMGYSGGGDSGGGIASFSSGSYSEDGSSPVSVNPLPDPAKGKATTGSQGVELWEGQNLTLTDENLKNAADAAQQQLKNDKNFSKFSFLIVGTTQKLNDGDVRIKLNDTYKGKVAYIFFMDTAGKIEKIRNSDKDYISYTLDETHFADNELLVRFAGQESAFIYVFGAN